MRKRHFTNFLLVVLITAVGLVLTACGGQRKNTNNEASATSAVAPAAAVQPKPEIDRTGWPVIVTFGDSLTAGQGVAYDRNYPSQLQEELDKLGYKYKVVNAGVSGDTTGGGLNRIEAVLAHKPEIVILELGANDGLRGMPIDAMRQNLAQIIEQLQQAQVQVVLAGMQIPPNYGPEYTESFKKSFDELAAQYKVPLIPFFLDGVAAKPELNQVDGIHPTADGYVYVIQNVMATLKPLLK